MVNCNIAYILIIQNLILIRYFSNSFKDITFTLRGHTVSYSSICSRAACECGDVVHLAGLKQF